MHSIIKFALIALALVVGFFAPDLLKNVNNRPSSVAIEDYCMLSTQACHQEGVSMTLDTDVTRPLVPTVLTVQWPNAKSDQLHVTLDGLEMDMGIARYLLTKQASGHFTGEILLPVCTPEKMTWIGTISDGQGERKAALRMEQ